MALETVALKTLTVMPRGRRPKTWTAGQQLDLDQRVKAQEIAQRQAKKAQSLAGDLVELPDA